jgi:predicted transcriptional regulator
MSKRKQGELEQAVLSCLWDRPDGLSSSQVLALIGDDSIAATTILTVLARLCDKGLVQKELSGGRALLFRATASREQHTAALLLAAMENSMDSGLAFSHFAQGLSPEQIASLKEVLKG